MPRPIRVALQPSLRGNVPRPVIPSSTNVPTAVPVTRTLFVPRPASSTHMRLIRPPIRQRMFAVRPPALARPPPRLPVRASVIMTATGNGGGAGVNRLPLQAAKLPNGQTVYVMPLVSSGAPPTRGTTAAKPVTVTMSSTPPQTLTMTSPPIVRAVSGVRLINNNVTSSKPLPLPVLVPRSVGTAVPVLPRPAATVSRVSAAGISVAPVSMAGVNVLPLRLPVSSQSKPPAGNIAMSRIASGVHMGKIPISLLKSGKGLTLSKSPDSGEQIAGLLNNNKSITLRIAPSPMSGHPIITPGPNTSHPASTSMKSPGGSNSIQIAPKLEPVISFVTGNAALTQAQSEPGVGVVSSSIASLHSSSTSQSLSLQPLIVTSARAANAFPARTQPDYRVSSSAVREDSNDSFFGDCSLPVNSADAMLNKCAEFNDKCLGAISTLDDVSQSPALKLCTASDTSLTSATHIDASRLPGVKRRYSEALGDASEPLEGSIFKRLMTHDGYPTQAQSVLKSHSAFSAVRPG